MAQPAVSQQIHKLESELRVTLFDRRPRPIQLTDAGETLLPIARHILAEFDRAVAEVQAFRGEFRGRVMVGAMQYLTMLELPDLLAAFRERHPGVRLHWQLGNTGELWKLLEADLIEVAICHSEALDQHPRFALQWLRTEELVVLVHAGNRLAGVREVRVEDLAQTPLIMFREGSGIQQAVAQAFTTAGLQPLIDFESSDFATAIALVKRDVGVTIVPRSIAAVEASATVGIPLSPTGLRRHVVLATRRDSYHSRALTAFIQYARRYLGTKLPETRSE